MTKMARQARHKVNSNDILSMMCSSNFNPECFWKLVSIKNLFQHSDAILKNTWSKAPRHHEVTLSDKPCRQITPKVNHWPVGCPSRNNRPGWALRCKHKQCIWGHGKDHSDAKPWHGWLRSWFLSPNWSRLSIDWLMIKIYDTQPRSPQKKLWWVRWIWITDIIPIYVYPPTLTIC